MGAVSERTTVQELPEIKVKKRHPGKIALGIAVASIAAATMAGSCTLLQRFGTNPDNTPGTTPITEPTPTFTPTNMPELPISPSASPIKASPTPEVTPTTEKQLLTNVAAFLGFDENGNKITPSPFPDRFYLFNSDKSPAPLGLLDKNVKLTNGVSSTIQADLLGERVVYDSANNKYLEGLYGITDGKGNRLIIEGDITKIDPNWSGHIYINHGILISQSSPNTKEETIESSNMQAALEKYNGQSVITGVVYYPDTSGVTNVPPDVTQLFSAQSGTVKDLVTYLEQISDKPYTQVPIPDSLKETIITKDNYATKLADNNIIPAKIPLTPTITPYNG